MGAGVICISIGFPTPWPPNSDGILINRTDDGETICLSVNTLGQMILRISSALRQDEFVFQTLNLTGQGVAVLSVRWEDERVSVHLNANPLRLLAEANGESFTLELSGYIPPPLRLIFPNLDPEIGTSVEEKFFLATIVDVDSKILSGTPYELIRAAGLLRQLLLDGSPLVTVVNRKHKVRLTFHASTDKSVPPKISTSLMMWFSPDVGIGLPTAPEPIVLHRFLSQPILMRDEKCLATIHDLIDMCSHVKGGIHLGIPKSSGEHALLNWDEAFKEGGGIPSLHALAGTCRVALLGLRPLVEAIGYKAIHAN